MADLFQRLLLATEHTDFDAGAEGLALAMAQRCQAPLACVFPLISNPEYEAIAPERAAQAEAQVADKIRHLLAHASTLGVQVNVRVRRGLDLYLEIVQEARDIQADLIVIRRRGQRGFLANLLVGEMVGKVVAHAPCHALIVPRKATMWSRRVLAAAEPGVQGRRVVATAMKLARECGMPLHVACVVTATVSRGLAEAFIDDCLGLARQQGMEAGGEVRNDKPHAGILAAAASSGSDLIVIGSREEGRLGRAWIGGVAQKVLGLSEYPVLALHPEMAQPTTDPAPS